MAWAIVSACTAAIHNFHGALAVRILLGFTEAPFYPGAIYLLSLFYTRREIATRISILYSESFSSFISTNSTPLTSQVPTSSLPLSLD